MKFEFIQIIVVTTALTAIQSSTAQPPPNLVPPPDLEELNLPGTPDFQIRLSSAKEWEQIPYGRKLSYAFAALHGSDESENLDDSDIELIKLGAKGTAPNDRYFSLLADSCAFAESQANLGSSINIDYIVRVFEDGDRFTLEDRSSHYEELFNRVSVEAKELLLAKIEAAQGANLFSTSYMNWALIGQRNPNRLRAAFLKGCETLQDRWEAHRFNRENPGARSIFIPVTKEEAPNVDR